MDDSNKNSTPNSSTTPKELKDKSFEMPERISANVNNQVEKNKLTTHPGTSNSKSSVVNDTIEGKFLKFIMFMSSLN